MYSRTHFLLFIILSILIFSYANITYAEEDKENEIDKIPFIKSIHFEDNDNFSDGKLHSIIISKGTSWWRSLLFWTKPNPLDESVLDKDLLSIETFYHQQGYLQVKATHYEMKFSPKRSFVDIYFFLQEGEITIIDSVKLIQKEIALKEDLIDNLADKLLLHSDKAFQELLLKEDENTLRLEFANYGFPYAQVESEIKITNKRAIIIYNVNPDSLCYIGDIHFSGYKSVEKHILEREMLFHSGDIYNSEILSYTRQRLYRLELFKYVRVNPILEGDIHIPIEITVQEAPLSALRFGIGYGTEDRLRGIAKYSNRNFLGDARRADLQLKFSALLGEISFQLHQPCFLHNRNDLSLVMVAKREYEKTYTRDILGPGLIFARDLGKQWQHTSTLRYDLIRLRLPVITAQEEMNTESGDLRYNKFLFSLYFGKSVSDNPFNPTSGWLWNIYLEKAGTVLPFGISEGIEEVLKTQSPDETSYSKIRTEGRLYIPLWYSILAFKLKIGLMYSDLEDIPTSIDNRFYAGGSNSIRGWARRALSPKGPLSESVGGNMLLESTLEARLPLYKSLGCVIFFDSGNVWREDRDFSFDTIKYSPGCGLRFNTIVGPLRADIGWKTPAEGQPPYRFHFSIGHAF